MSKQTHKTDIEVKEHVIATRILGAELDAGNSANILEIEAPANYEVVIRKILFFALTALGAPGGLEIDIYKGASINNAPIIFSGFCAPAGSGNLCADINFNWGNGLRIQSHEKLIFYATSRTNDILPRLTVIYELQRLMP